MRLIELAVILTLSLILAPLGANAQLTFSGSCQAICF